MRTACALALVLGCAAPVSTRQPVDLWFIFVDDLHVSFMDTGRLRALVRAVSAHILHEGALFALASSRPSSATVGLTNDIGPLGAAINRLTGNGLRAEDVAQDRRDRRAVSEVAARMDRAISILREGLRDFTDRNGPPTSMLIISSGLVTSTTYQQRWAAALGGVLRPDTQVYLLDPRNEDGTPADRLQSGRVGRRR